VPDNESRFGKEERRYGATHSQFVTLGSRSLVYGAVGIPEGTRDLVMRVLTLQVVQVGKVVAYDLDGHFAGDLAGGVPTHPIRDYEQPAECVGRSVERVFITFSNPADISACRNSKVH
jgi:hypothetical protein